MAWAVGHAPTAAQTPAETLEDADAAARSGALVSLVGNDLS